VFRLIILTTAALLTLPFGAAVMCAQSPSLAQETQARGYWIDPATNLMWAGKDNGENLKWKKAAKYCGDLKLAGYSDWRLASLEELQGIYDKNAESPGLMGDKYYHNVSPSTWHVKGGLFLTGSNWTSNRRLDDRGKPSGYAWRFDFNDGRPFDGDEESFTMGKRALCLRASSANTPNKNATNPADHS
jgi:hypothetical protein